MKNQYQISTEDLNLISRVITGEADSGETELFEKRMNTESGFPSKVEEVRLLITGVREVNLAASLKEWHEKMNTSNVPDQSKGKIRSLKYIIPAAVAALIIIVTGIWFMINPGPQENIYSQYYKPDPGLPTVMSANSDYAFKQGMVYYKSEQYSQAIEQWSPLLETEPENDTLLYYMAQAYLALGLIDDARKPLEKIFTLSESEYLGKAAWYLGLIYLKENNKEEGKALILQSDHQQKEKILSEMK